MKRSFVIISVACLLTGVFLGWLIFGRNAAHTGQEGTGIAEQQAGQIWTCSMHPQIRQKEPGKCPICGMDLIPLEGHEGAADPLAVQMTPEAMQLANVETAVVQSGNAQKKIRLNGKVQADERRIFSQASHIPGRVEQLRVNFTGEWVSKGQVIALIYSPELITAQEELFEAARMRNSQPGLFEASVEKLKNWKLTEKQIETILSAGKPQEVFPVLSDVTGYVLNRKVNTGDYVMQGMSLFEIADLSAVWVLFDVYEIDLPFLKTGNEVVFSVSSLPGQEFKGKVSYIDPVIDAVTRVARARVEVQNAAYRLKPEMFASGVVNSWLSEKENQLVVPKSAVLWSGERSVVYVKQTTPNGVAFRMREVITGATLGDQVVIRSGLEPGEEIAVRGTFSIDAAAQLAGKPSMMHPEGGTAVQSHQHGHIDNKTQNTQQVKLDPKAKQALIPVFEAYFTIKDALASDRPPEARTAAATMQKALDAVSMAHFKGSAHDLWMQYSTALTKSLAGMNRQQDVQKLRDAFRQVSKTMIAMAKAFRPLDNPLYVDFCPMADNNKGAYWLSTFEEVRNPYFGSAMLSCGEVTETIK